MKSDRDDQSILDRLFEAYRQACADFDPSPDFTPSIWARIDASRPVGWFFPVRRLAVRLVTGTALASALLIGFLSLGHESPESSVDVLEASYVDALTADVQDQLDDDLWLVAGSGR